MRQTLYGEFLAECARLLMDAFQHSLEKPDTFVPVYTLVNRIRLCASPAVLREAEQLVRRITEQYFASNLSVEELRQLARTAEADALRAFGETCRGELNSIQARL
jgi:reverse gyrase